MGNIKTVVVILLLLFSFEEFLIQIRADNNKFVSYNKDPEKKKKTKKGNNQAYDIHFKRQTKKVQKRMKEDNKKIKKYYNKKLGNTLLQRLFGKNKNR